MKSVNHRGWGIHCKVKTGLGTEIILGKHYEVYQKKLLFKLVLKLIILLKFYKERRRLLALIKTICLNS